MENKLIKQTPDQISNQTGLPLDYVKRVLVIKSKLQLGEPQLAAISTGWSNDYVNKTLAFTRTSTKIIEALETIQKNHAELIADMPVGKYKN